MVPSAQISQKNSPKLVLRAAFFAVGLVHLPLGAVAQSFELSDVAFNNSVYLDDTALAGVVAPYMNRPLVFEDVAQMMAGVEALYAAEGVVTASVVLQPQEVRDGGVLRLTLIEAQTEAIEYEARTGFQNDLLANVFDAPVNAFPDYDAITEQIRFFQIAYGVVPTVGFAAGQAPASTVQSVGIDAQPQANWRIQLDNYANDSEDRTQLTLSREYFDFSGRLDSLSVSAALTAGGVTISGNYALPVGPYGGKVTTSGSIAQSEVVAGAFAASQLETRSLEFGAAYAQPFWVSSDTLYQFQLGLNASNTNSTIAGIDLQDNTLVDLEARLIFARSYARSALSADAGLRFGTATSAEESETDGEFAMAFANAAYERAVTENYAFKVTGRAQLAPDQNLPSGQRFSAGGLASLVGYPDDVRTGDSGLTGRVQLTCVSPCLGDRFATYWPEIYVFADAGVIETFRGDDASVDEEPVLYSVGVGGSMQVRGAIISAALGVPLAETTGFEDTGTPRFYAGVSYEF